MTKTKLVQTVNVEALPSKVWKVLTTESYIQQYFPDGSLFCDWTEGSPISHIFEVDPGIEKICHGTVLQVIPGMSLKYRLEEPDRSGFTVTSFELAPGSGSVDLKLTCDGIPDDEYYARMQQLYLVLQKIKWLAEYS